LSFPGGKIEFDETAIDAAMRETLEEVGLRLKKKAFIGELSPLYVFGSKNWLRCFVFFDSAPIETHDLRVDPSEVEKAFFVPLSHFQNEINKAETQMDFAGDTRIVPHWKVPQTSTPLWGATALILNELMIRIDLVMHG
jgi:8-oxo-dGTP pyrophosphatase MutT (NUDIX family)